MGLYVQKFGGTSVATLERIQAVAQTIASTRQAGHEVVVVVSAMAGETNRLLEMANCLQSEPNGRELAALVTTGEMVSSNLLALALQSLGVAACSLNAYQLNLRTDHHYSNAHITHIDTQAITDLLAQGSVVVVAGFQGVNDEKEMTMLGRGGSDTTAVALGAALDADECQIFTDVEGVFTADPKMVPQARLVPRISFEEMMMLASQGSRVLQNTSVEFAGKYRVPLRVLSSFGQCPGTLIDFEKPVSDQAVVSGIASQDNIAKLTVLGFTNPLDATASVLQALEQAEVEIDLLSQQLDAAGQAQIILTIPQGKFKRGLPVLQRVGKQIGATHVRGQPGLAKLSVIGVGMHSHPEIGQILFKTLSEAQIPTYLVEMSALKASVVVPGTQLVHAMQMVHSAFGLDAEADLS